MRVAAIDCGTNSVRLLIAEPAGRTTALRSLVREMRIVRLGEGVDSTGSLAPQAIERTRLALVDYAVTIEAQHAERIRMVATSATRDARNRDDFVAMVRSTLDTEPEVITGMEEAALSYAGAVGTLPAASGPVLLADIGGGSTELVLGASTQAGSGGDLQSYSMDIGSVRMTERHLHDDPPTPAQIDAAVTDIRAGLHRAGAAVPLDTGATLVGVAGTVTTLAGIVLDLAHYNSEAIHGSTISAAQLNDLTARLLTSDHAQRAAIPVLHPGRIDVIGAGALVLRTLVEVTGAPYVVVSEHDILDGIALSQLAES